MILDPLLRAGLEPFQRRDFEAADAAWRAASAATADDERAMFTALADLAAALDRERRGAPGSGAALYESVRHQLDALPARLLGLDLAALQRTLPATVAAAAARPPGLPPARRLGGAFARFLVLVAVLGAGLAAFSLSPLAEHFSGREIVQLLGRLSEHRLAPGILLALYVVLAPLGLPISPLIFAGGMVFGPVWGSILNILGSFLGAAATFLLARVLGREFVAGLLGQRRVARAERLLERHGFWALVRIRFIPLPFAAVNYAAALSGIRLPVFLSASALGITPATVIYTYFAWAFVGAASGQRAAVARNLAVALTLVMALTLAPALIRRWRRRRRYRALLAARRQRSADRGAS